MAWHRHVRGLLQRGAYFHESWHGFARTVADDWAEHVPVTDEEGQEAVDRLGIDVGAWADNVRARVAAVTERSTD